MRLRNAWQHWWRDDLPRNVPIITIEGQPADADVAYPLWAFPDDLLAVRVSDRKPVKESKVGTIIKKQQRCLFVRVVRIFLRILRRIMSSKQRKEGS